VVQPPFRLEPVSAHRPRGHTEDFAGLLLRESAKEPALHYLAESRIQRLELLQRLVQRQQRLRTVLHRHDHLVQRDGALVPAPLGRAVPPGVVHENLPHGPGGDAVEVGAIVVLEPGLIHQSEIGLVDQPGGAEGVAGLLAAERAAGDAPQLLVDQRIEPVHDGSASAAQLQQQLGDGLGVRGVGWLEWLRRQSGLRAGRFTREGDAGRYQLAPRVRPAQSPFADVRFPRGVCAS
jgi:hypothetical protein